MKQGTKKPDPQKQADDLALAHVFLCEYEWYQRMMEDGAAPNLLGLLFEITSENKLTFSSTLDRAEVRSKELRSQYFGERIIHYGTSLSEAERQWQGKRAYCGLCAQCKDAEVCPVAYDNVDVCYRFRGDYTLTPDIYSYRDATEFEARVAAKMAQWRGGG